MSRIYVSDANILIDFRNAGLLDELFSLPFALCCTDFVARELRDIALTELISKGMLVESMDGDTIKRLFDLMTLHNNSSLADVSCYLLAKETQHPLLTGGGRLRRQALQDGIQVHGALWLLDQLVESAVISVHKAADGLDRVMTHGARLPSGDCQSRLSSWRRAN